MNAVFENYSGALYNGDVREVLPLLPDKSVHCCVTSPPYFGLRDYGKNKQIGLEKTPEKYVSELVAVFREVRRILKDNGTLWLNLGDSYTGYHGNSKATYGEASSNKSGYFENQRSSTVGLSGLKNKDLIGIPWRVAFALQADGWFLRQDIIWHKPNPMPESVSDRCTKAHEYVFLLSKQPRYFFDCEAIKEPAKSKNPTGPNYEARGQHAEKRKRGTPLRHSQYESSDQSGLDSYTHSGKRNKRSVWTVATRAFRGAHFATFPTALIEPCILAGCPEGGIVLDPFSGSGTTLAVAFANRRRAVGVELNADYCALALERLKTK